ncbi:hypothetical protein RCL1_007155 [Eukaryota sp. TZLM3-RCL]
MFTNSSSQPIIPKPKPKSLIESLLSGCEPLVFSESFCLKTYNKSKSSLLTSNTCVGSCDSGYTFDLHDKYIIAFDRTDGVPIPSFLFHRPLADCYNNLFSEQFLRSYTFRDSCSMYVTFNMLRSILPVETGLQEQLLIERLFQPFKNNAKYGRSNPYCDLNSTYQPEFLITANLCDIIAEDLSEDAIDQILANYYEGIFMNDKDVAGENLELSRNGFLNYPLLTVMLKQSSSYNSHCVFQCALYALRCIGKNPIFTTIGCPTYLLLLVGTHVSLYSMAYTSYVVGPSIVGQQRYTVSLMCDFDFSRGEEDSALRFAAFFAQLKDSLSALETYVRDCIKKKLSCSNFNISSLPILDHFGISLRHLFSESPLVYHATFQDEDVTVKFTSSYAFDLHQQLANLELAPRLIHCKLLDSGLGLKDTETLQELYKPIRYGDWYIVVMQRCAAIPLAPPTPEQLSVTINQLYQLKSFLHASCFVHGDLRPSNVLLTSKGISVIDFDWAGNTQSECPPRYPFSMFHETYKEMFVKAEAMVGTVLVPTVELVRCSSEIAFIKWPQGAYPGSLILHDHDVYWIDQMIEILCRMNDVPNDRHTQDNIDRAKDTSDALIAGKRRSS